MKNLSAKQIFLSAQAVQFVIDKKIDERITLPRQRESFPHELKKTACRFRQVRAHENACWTSAENTLYWGLERLDRVPAGIFRYRPTECMQDPTLWAVAFGVNINTLIFYESFVNTIPPQ